MGLFFRKSIRIGKHCRINIGKHGIGYSVGVKGLRVGKSSTGKNYISGGKDGVYFRQNISGGTAQQIQQPKLRIHKDHKTLKKLLKWTGIAFLGMFLFGLAIELLPLALLIVAAIFIVGAVKKHKLKQE